MEFPASELWDFSLTVYGRDGVSAACIALQDRHGLDVDILLACCWAGASGRGALEATDIETARAAIGPWQGAVTAALRAVRRRIKDGIGGAAAPAGLAATLGKRVLTLEIDGEHVAQLVLEAALVRTPAGGRTEPERARDAARGLAAYLSDARVVADEADRARLLTILGGTFPDLDPGALRALLPA